MPPRANPSAEQHKPSRNGYALVTGFASTTLRGFASFGMFYTPSEKTLIKAPPLPVEFVQWMLDLFKSIDDLDTSENMVDFPPEIASAAGF